jgi:sulfur carrier protein
MKVTVNGEDHALPNGSTVSDLVESMGLEPRGVAVAVNREVVSKSEWQEFELSEGQRIEILRAVQGG